MSSESMAWAWVQDVPRMQKFILLALAHSGGESHSGALTQVELAELTGASRRTVSRAVQALCERGLITKNVVRNTHDMGSTFRYSLNVGRLSAVVCDEGFSE